MRNLRHGEVRSLIQGATATTQLRARQARQCSAGQCPLGCAVGLRGRWHPARTCPALPALKIPAVWRELPIMVLPDLKGPTYPALWGISPQRSPCPLGTPPLTTSSVQGLGLNLLASQVLVELNWKEKINSILDQSMKLRLQVLFKSWGVTSYSQINPMRVEKCI